MQASFAKFVADHEAIEAAAAALLDEVRHRTAYPASLARMLDDLAEIIAEHIRREDEVVRSIDGRNLFGPWVETWEEGRSEFEQLTADWASFIDRWSSKRISEERPRFSFECRAILNRVSERLRQKTRLFYATALQFRFDQPSMTPAPIAW